VNPINVVTLTNMKTSHEKRKGGANIALPFSHFSYP